MEPETLRELGPVALDGFEVWDRTVQAPAGSAKKVAFVSVRKGGVIGVSVAARALLDPCDPVKIMYDPKQNRIGQIPADPEAQDSYRISRHSNVQIACRKLFEYYDIEVTETRRIYDLEMVDGVLIVDLGAAADV